MRLCVSVSVHDCQDHKSPTKQLIRCPKIRHETNNVPDEQHTFFYLFSVDLEYQVRLSLSPVCGYWTGECSELWCGTQSSFWLENKLQKKPWRGNQWHQIAWRRRKCQLRQNRCCNSKNIKRDEGRTDFVWYTESASSSFQCREQKQMWVVWSIYLEKHKV